MKMAPKLKIALVEVVLEPSYCKKPQKKFQPKNWFRE